MRLEIRKITDEEGNVTWSLLIDGEEIMQQEYKTSRLLTGATNEGGRGIFSAGEALKFYWGSHQQTFRMLPVFENLQSVEDCRKNMIKNIQVVRTWVEKLKRENAGTTTSVFEV